MSSRHTEGGEPRGRVPVSAFTCEQQRHGGTPAALVVGGHPHSTLPRQDLGFLPSPRQSPDTLPRSAPVHRHPGDRLRKSGLVGNPDT
jgi:hypothetical protein